MIETILLIVILAQFTLSVWKEIQYNKHIRELENKIKAGSLTEFYQTKDGVTKSPASPIMRTDENEVMLNEIPFMEIPKEFKIEHEGSPETPAEAVARKES